MTTEPTERLHKVLAHAGVASRRAAEALIQEGRVTVNGRVVTELGAKVDPARDDIRVDGRRVQAVAQHVYILLHKPRGVLSVMRDPRGRRALADLVKAPGRIYPVGRLDADSTGLILLTDDGELANLLTHPRHGHEKEYEVLVHGHPGEETLAAWRRGIVVEGERTAPAAVTVLRQERDTTLLRVVMHEGRKRQIRNVARTLGHPVLELQRVRLGPLRLGTLKPGEWRRATSAELEALRAVKAEAGRGKKQGAASRRPEAKDHKQETGGRRTKAGPTPRDRRDAAKRGGVPAPPEKRGQEDRSRGRRSGRRSEVGAEVPVASQERQEVGGTKRSRGRGEKGAAHGPRRGGRQGEGADAPVASRGPQRRVDAESPPASRGERRRGGAEAPAKNRKAERRRGPGKHNRD